MYPRLVTSCALALAACSGASLGDGPPESAGGPDAAVLAPDAREESDAAPASCDDPRTYFRDADADGYGDPAVTMDACAVPTGYVTNATDCDDRNRMVHPAAIEVCGDDVDNDCSGADACAEAELGRWAFDDATGAADTSGNGRNGILRNGAQVTGGAVVLDGNDDFVEVADDPSFARADGTLAVWFRADDLTVERGLMSRDSAGRDGGGHLSLWVTGQGSARVRLQSDTGNYEIVAGNVAAGADYHVVATFGASGLRLYVNGELVSSNGYTGGTAGNVEPLVIGASSQSSDDASATPISDPFDGRIYDARFYGRALSGTEIAELFARTTPP